LGDSEKLAKFLELNPSIRPDTTFIEGYDFTAYQKVGLGKIGQNTELAKQAKLKSPEGVDWWKYLSNIGKLSPIPKDMKFGDVPEGVLWLGATFVVDGDNIKFAWSDRIPGDHPEVDVVLKAAEATSA